MILAAYNSTKPTLLHIRRLSSQEIEMYEPARRTYSQARELMGLFQRLHRSFKEWESFVKAPARAVSEFPGYDFEEANRLLLNYLSSAYAVIEQIRSILKRRYRIENRKTSEVSNWLNDACAKSRSFALALDLRSYLQHQRSGVGEYRIVHEENGSKHLFIGMNADKLASGRRDWMNSKLQAADGEINLVNTIQEANQFIFEGIFEFVVGNLLEDWIAAHKFYESLWMEVESRASSSRVVLLEELPHVVSEQGVQIMKLKMIMLPSSLFNELGIKISFESGDLPEFSGG